MEKTKVFIFGVCIALAVYTHVFMIAHERVAWALRP